MAKSRIVRRNLLLVYAAIVLVACGGAIAAATVAGLFWADKGRLRRLVETTPGTNPTESSADNLRDQFPGWPKLHGPSGHSTSGETGLATSWEKAGPPEIWRRKIGTGYSSPVVTDAGLFLLHRLDDFERLECLDPETGDCRWKCEYATNYKCQVRYSSGPYSTPVIDGDRVFAQSAEGALRCLSVESGKVLWKRELSREYEVPETEWGVGHSPCVSQGRVFINLGGTPSAGVIALDAMTGETLWSATDYRSSYATPVLATMHGREHLFVFNSQGCVSLDPADGRERWFVEFGIGRRTGSANAVSPLVSGDLLLLTAGPGPGCLCLRILPSSDYEEVWRERRVLDSQFNNQILLNGHVYGFTSKWQGESNLVCLDLRTGKARWKWTSDLGRGSGLAADGRLILLGEAGHLASLDATPEGPKIRAFTTEPLLEAPCYSAPALHRGLLYVRNERCIRCLNLR